MIRKINRKAMKKEKFYYRCFDKTVLDNERPRYSHIENSNEFELVLNQFFSENRLKSISHDDIFSDHVLKEEYMVTLIGTNHIIQFNNPLYDKYRDLIENMLIEVMNYNAIKDLITKDTEFILNMCSSGLIYDFDNSNKIDKVYIYLLDRCGRQLICDIFTDISKDKNSFIEVIEGEDKKYRLVCGEKEIFMNRKLFEHLSLDILAHNRQVSKIKVLTKK